MASARSIIINHGWADVPTRQNWIKTGDIKYQYLSNELINKVFPILQSEDKNLLLDGLVRTINLIHVKFGFGNNNEKNDSLLWDQLTQNSSLDLRALLGIMLPFINDNETDDKKHQLKRLADLYLEKDNTGAYIYNNSQYNRCIRHMDGNTIKFFPRPYLKEYFQQHLELLLMSIETVANKLYVNWVDILPIRMNQYTNTKLYSDTVAKIGRENITSVDLINGYIDPMTGLSYQDIYNVMSNHLYHEIKNHKWLIYDIIIAGNATSYVLYLEQQFDLDRVWDGLLWSQLDDNSRNTFTYEWNIFLGSSVINNNIVLSKFYFFFSKYHRNAKKLISRNELVLTTDTTMAEDDDEESAQVTPETTRNAKIGMANVPIEEIYLFFYDQFLAFKKSWFYYVIKIKKEKFLGKRALGQTGVEIFITPKNVYNYCKSLTHYTGQDLVTGMSRYYEIPRHWHSLKPELVEMVLIRILDIARPSSDRYDRLQNDWSKPNWFNINNYLRRLYPAVGERLLLQTNQLIHSFIRTRLVDIIFESLIYHGLLSEFVPNKKITANAIVETSINSADDQKKTEYKRNQMSQEYFTGTMRDNYENHAYYFITSTTYGQLKPVKSGTYFDFLVSEQNWTFTYAMNWVSQINFYHHYINNRVIYVTGATGVGKSTQVPPLLMYGQKMVDYNLNGKIICTEPRVPPTETNTINISKNLGVPIMAYDTLYEKNIFTNNYYVQFKHQKKEHLAKTDAFLRIVTDGTLYEEMKASAFMTRSVDDPYAVDVNQKPIPWAKTFSSGNKYDILIVDEAHEHNANMDMILTLARDAAYINNSLKIIIISATMEDDEPIYRRYYRTINDNRAYPLSAFIENQKLDRANMDRRIHISPPGATTQFVIEDFYDSKAESDLINSKNFVDYGIKRTINLANSTTEKDILLFMSGQADIKKAVKEINNNTAANIIAMGFYSELSEETKTMIINIDQTLPQYTRYKDDVFLEEKDVIRKVPMGTYNRAIIIATNVAEASITLKNLRYVVDTGYAKTVIYDALEGVPKTFILPISWSSSTQRRGRVGRVASGIVYHLYAKEKIVNNKTAYKIADEDAKNHIVPLLKTDPRDGPIITKENDINNLYNIHTFRKKMELGPSEPDVVYNVLKNPRPYLDIIQKQYLYIADFGDISQYYLYYGKTVEEYYNLSSLLNNMHKYMIENHDDYHYQMQATEYWSRGYTGYDDFMLEDSTLLFYIIHPDENVITRNLYTGKMEGIKCNPSVTEAYYYYLLKVNRIRFNSEDIAMCKFPTINFDNFYFLKYDLAISDAKLQMLVLEIPTRTIDFRIQYNNITEHNIAIDVGIYFRELSQRYKQQYIAENTVTVKSTLLENLSAIQKLSSQTVLNDINNLMWYSFSIPYGLENDVLAVITLMTLVTDISQWIGEIKSKQDIQKFFSLHSNSHGDFYFVWKLWVTIKDLLENKNLLEITKVDVGLEIQFKNYKEQFLRNVKIPFEEFLIFDKMYKSGQLNTHDEFYYYVKQLVIDFKQIIENIHIDKYLDIIASNNKLNPEKLYDFLVQYLDIISTQNRNIWLYQYEIENKLTEEPVNTNIIEWAQRKLSLPGIINNPTYEPTKWDRMLEIYIRAFSMNLLKNEGNYYLRINKGIRLDPDYWSKNLILEKTLLNNKTEFIIYHSNQTVNDVISAAYLTSVKLEWVIQLNPVYYYYFFFDKNNILNKMKADEDVIRSVNIIRSNMHLFDHNALIAYLDQIDNPVISGIIREDLAT
jgi:ABC-type phosphate transport system ATPase subunit